MSCGGGVATEAGWLADEHMSALVLPDTDVRALLAGFADATAQLDAQRLFGARVRAFLRS